MKFELKMDVGIDVKHKEVEKWLETMYGNAVSVPEYEKTSTSIELLYELMNSTKQAESRANILTQDYQCKTKEYRAKAEEEAKVLQGVHIRKSGLSANAQEAVENIAMAANIINAKSPIEADIMLGYALLEGENDKVMQQCTSNKKSRSLLVNLSQKFASKLEHANSLSQQAAASCSIEAKNLQDNEKKEHFYERKLMEYETEVNNMECELSHRGYSKELSHSNICKEHKNLEELRNEISILQVQLESYSLPPDMDTARLTVQQTRKQLETVLNDMVSVQNNS